MERAGVADAGRAAVADDVEPELVEIFLQAGLVQIIGDNARTRRERSLDRGIDRQAALDRLLREQTGGEHDTRVARVRATGDRRDEHAAVADPVWPCVKYCRAVRLRSCSPASASADSRPSRALLRSSPGSMPWSVG